MIRLLWPSILPPPTIRLQMNLKVAALSLSVSMDVSETVAKRDYVGGGLLRKVKAGRPMKRSKNVRKTKALAKALSKSEQSVEKISKSESKVLRTKSAKNLYQ
ncbi:uncharacterized protein LOC125201049 isoform X3 [Salvia hispanica]|uniref:uncharacterized protein LOC125201049 isoform X3 n=1 Tax=Salvia hispanica TaxID=49212 RepID=UPI002009643C|nr:uncharacterized protein LOC125201049 isoform X3 [Salvia hispanica]